MIQVLQRQCKNESLPDKAHHSTRVLKARFSVQKVSFAYIRLMERATKADILPVNTRSHEPEDDFIIKVFVDCTSKLAFLTSVRSSTVSKYAREVHPGILPRRATKSSVDSFVYNGSVAGLVNRDIMHPSLKM